jgi:hypothetical protein
MTEAEWEASTEPTALLVALRTSATDRKLRLLVASVLRLSLGEYPEDWHITKSHVAHISECEFLADGDAEACRQNDGRLLTSTDVRNDAVGVIDLGKPSKVVAKLRLLRDIFGNPFRPVVFSPSWRTSTAVALARTMYDAREFSAMPILADALQDAGCDNDDILTHCRDANQTHVRGCWVVDLVLGKE